jgi:hypothetical protein
MKIMNVLIKIDPGAQHRVYSYSRGLRSNKTIKGLLLDKGYNDRDIKRLIKEQRILIAPGSLARKIKAGENLFVLADCIKLNDKTISETNIDRFSNLEQ